MGSLALPYDESVPYQQKSASHAQEAHGEKLQSVISTTVQRPHLVLQIM